MILAKHALLLFLLSGSILAQQLGHPLMVSRQDARTSSRPFTTTADTIDCLAVMVQFQQDNTALTSGDGRFDLSLGTDPVLDAPPHNKQYFLDHFTFVANYFSKASKQKVFVRAKVLDSIVTLPGHMQDYAPPRTGSTIAVGNLARDTWQKVDSARLDTNLSRYQCFVVLHAGTGRDIDLVNLLGYDPTPYDIPSLYIGLNGFREYYGSNYQGIPVNGGTFFITNSIVIPELESRSLPTATGTSLLELTINGLMCASMGNYLGLPDLFDTNTGRSGIGRFGLMDGQAIFSFRGVFPPEPSAWERYWLGWIEPITLQAGEQTVSLPAVSLPDSDVVYRIPISAQEYFLMENRNRKAQRPNSQTVFSTFMGTSHEQRFGRDTVGFDGFLSDISALAGVVTDVSELDWSLPGGFDGTTFFDGGILIWHIDEAVIAQGLQTNGVNANPLRRGVDLEEADGSQDIGQQYDLLSPGALPLLASCRAGMIPSSATKPRLAKASPHAVGSPRPPATSSTAPNTVGATHPIPNPISECRLRVAPRWTGSAAGTTPPVMAPASMVTKNMCTAANVSNASHGEPARKPMTQLRVADTAGPMVMMRARPKRSANSLPLMLAAGPNR